MTISVWNARAHEPALITASTTMETHGVPYLWWVRVSTAGSRWSAAMA